MANSKKRISKYFSEAVNTETFKQSGVTFFTTIVNGALGAVFYIVAARLLGPSSFGIMNLAIMVLTLGASIGGLGVNTSLVRFVSQYLENDKTKAYQFLKVSLVANFAIGIIFIVLGVFFSAQTAEFIFANKELTHPLQISFYGVGFLLLFSFATRCLQSFQQFWWWGGIQIGSNLVRIVAVIILYFAGVFTLSTSLWLYALIPLAGFIFAILFLIPRDFLFVKGEGSVAREFFHYNKWVAGFTIVSAASSRMDTFITARMVSPEALGYYAAAYQLVYIVPQIVSSLGTVISPKMAAMGKRSEFLAYFKKTQLLVSGLALLGLLSIPVVSFFVPFIFGSEYLGAIPLFIVLLISMLVFLISLPVHNAILYYFAYPRIFLWISVGHLLLITVVSWYLASTMGAMGAAIAVLIGSVFNFVVPLIWMLKKLSVKDSK